MLAQPCHKLSWVFLFVFFSTNEYIVVSLDKIDVSLFLSRICFIVWIREEQEEEEGGEPKVGEDYLVLSCQFDVFVSTSQQWKYHQVD